MSDLSAHDWVQCVWRHRKALVCGRCGYLWKPSLARPTKDCAGVPLADRKEEPVHPDEPGAQPP